jgi:hypothetical protein
MGVLDLRVTLSLLHTNLINDRRAFKPDAANKSYSAKPG